MAQLATEKAQTLLKCDGGVEVQLLPGGATGKTFLAKRGEEKYVLRLLPAATEAWTSNFDLVKVSKAVADAGIGAQVIDSDEGAILVEFVPESRPFDLKEDFLHETNGKAKVSLFAQTAAKFHALDAAALSLSPAGNEIQTWVEKAIASLEAHPAKEKTAPLIARFRQVLKDSEALNPYNFADRTTALAPQFASEGSALAQQRTSHGDLHFGNLLLPGGSADKAIVVDLDRVAPRRLALDLAYFFLLWGDQYMAKGLFPFPPPANGPALPYAPLADRRLIAESYLQQLRQSAPDDAGLATITVDELLLEVEYCTYIERFRLFAIYTVLSGGDPDSMLIAYAVAPGLSEARMQVVNEIYAQLANNVELQKQALEEGITVMIANKLRALSS